LWIPRRFLSERTLSKFARFFMMKTFALFLFAVMIQLSAFGEDGPVRHVVHFKFKADADPAEVAKVVSAFAALQGKIPAISSIEFGTNMSKEGLNRGLTHCWIVSFKSAADRDAYLVHPDHVVFVGLLKPVLAEALVVDFIPTK